MLLVVVVLLLFEGDCELFFGDLELLFRRLMPDWLELILALVPVGIGYYLLSACAQKLKNIHLLLSNPLDQGHRALQNG